MLNLHHNNLVCLRQLPKLPAVEHLCLSENAISSLGGLGALGNSPLRSLNLTCNPVTFTQDYRARWEDFCYGIKLGNKQRKRGFFIFVYCRCSVFSCLPKLEVLDGIPKLPEDSLPLRPHFAAPTRMCNILWHSPVSGCGLTQISVLSPDFTNTTAKAEIVFTDFFKGKPTGIQLFTQTVSQLLLKTLFRPHWIYHHQLFDGNMLQGHEEWDFLYSLHVNHIFLT